jgi:hypothetical protein
MLLCDYNFSMQGNHAAHVCITSTHEYEQRQPTTITNYRCREHMLALIELLSLDAAAMHDYSGIPASTFIVSTIRPE